MSYNLNDNVNDSFEFELRGGKYTMRYPTLEEIEKLQKLVEENPDDDDKVMDFMFSYITPQGEAKDIKTALKKENVRVIRNFTAMVKTEFGVDG